MIAMRRLYLLVCILYLNTGLASEYFELHERGWHWYDDPIIQQERHDKKQHVTPTEKQNQTLDDMKAEIKSAMDTAIMQPTLKNIEQYMILQEQMVQRASQFSSLWQRVLLNNPHLDSRLQYPTNGIGRKIYYEQEASKKHNAIRYFFRDHGLFFFYRSDCAYCHHFAPILARFTHENGITLIPISLDGRIIPIFPQSRIDNGQSKAFNVKYWPALFAINPRTNRAIPIAYGLLSESELEQRILDVAETYRSER